jgi:hypothetical protein
MAKASTGRTASAKGKSAPPPAPTRKQAKTAVVAPKPVAKKALVKAAAPKMASAPGKAAAPRTAPAKAPPPKKAIAKVRATAAKKAPAPPGKSATVKASARSAAAKTTAAAKTGTRAKTVAVKKAAPRRPAVRTAVPTPSARRGRPAAAPRKAPAAAAPSRNLGAGTPQVFTVSHLNEADFKTDGLRAYAQYRDLGIAAATGGLCQAHVIRLTPPCTDDVRKRHLHQAELQLVYVLKGWMKNEFEGQGEQMMSAGSCWLQPSGIKHTVLDYSADCEVLEIIVPADFKTEDLT